MLGNLFVMESLKDIATVRMNLKKPVMILMWSLSARDTSLGWRIEQRTGSNDRDQWTVSSNICSPPITDIPSDTTSSRTFALETHATIIAQAVCMPAAFSKPVTNLFIYVQLPDNELRGRRGLDPLQLLPGSVHFRLFQGSRVRIPEVPSTLWSTSDTIRQGPETMADGLHTRIVITWRTA